LDFDIAIRVRTATAMHPFWALFLGSDALSAFFFSFPIELANANGQHDLGHFQVEGREAPERHPGLRCIAGRMQSKDVTTNPVARCYNVT
jgi:hypothetical protein